MHIHNNITTIHNIDTLIWTGEKKWLGVRVGQLATGCPPFQCHLLDDIQTASDPWMASVEHSLARSWE